jgi:hypothetical protein
VAASDPLPAAFSATLGRALPLGGTEGVALLLTVVVELISCFGLAGLSVLSNERQRSGRPMKGSLVVGGDKAGDCEGALVPATRQSIPLAEVVTLPKPSLRAVDYGLANTRRHRRNEVSNSPSNVVPMRPPSSSANLAKGASSGLQGGAAGGLALIGSHVSAFVQERLRHAHGASIAAKDLRAAYESWCSVHGHTPLSQPKLAAELKALGYGKWKSCGLMRYRDLQLVA